MTFVSYMLNLLYFLSFLLSSKKLIDTISSFRVCDGKLEGRLNAGKVHICALHYSEVY